MAAVVRGAAEEAVDDNEVVFAVVAVVGVALVAVLEPVEEDDVVT
jgi:hypothetical protein